MGPGCRSYNPHNQIAPESLVGTAPTFLMVE